jgi:hypothetical protein
MNYTLKKKSCENLIDDYMNSISYKCEKTIPIIKNPLKISDDRIIVPTITTYKDLTQYNYNVSQLKTFAKHYKLKISGNKNELVNRIYSYLYFSSYINKIQKVFRGVIVRKYKNIHGIAANNRKLCTNQTDFITMEPIEDINFHQFVSYKDSDGFIYGFDIASLYGLIFLKGYNGKICSKNPYNRNYFPENLLINIKTLLRLSRILKININLEFEDDTKHVSCEKAIELRALTLFQNIDSLGNYSNPQWFLSLNKQQLIKFIRELNDIWNYRAQLSQETKRNICPPIGDPFRNLSMSFIHSEDNMSNIKKVVLDVLEKLVNIGIDTDSKSLGAYYVLGSLTLVNQEAATSLPWLFQSVSYF